MGPGWLFRVGVHAKEACVRIVGLPLFLWEKDFFELMGDACGGLFWAWMKT